MAEYIVDDNETTEYFDSLEEAEKYAASRIDDYLDDDRWDENVGTVVIAKVIRQAAKTNVVHRPPDSELIEGYDKEGTSWGDHEYRCSYEMRDVEEFQSQQTLRLDSHGRDVTGLPWLHSEDDTCWVRVETS